MNDSVLEEFFTQPLAERHEEEVDLLHPTVRELTPSEFARWLLREASMLLIDASLALAQRDIVTALRRICEADNFVDYVGRGVTTYVDTWQGGSGRGLAITLGFDPDIIDTKSASEVSEILADALERHHRVVQDRLERGIELDL